MSTITVETRTEIEVLTKDPEIVVIALPAFAGSRSHVEPISAQLPQDPKKTLLILKADESEAFGWAFCDELINQVLQQRTTASLAVIGATEHMTDHLVKAASNRAVLERLFVSVR